VAAAAKTSHAVNGFIPFLNTLYHLTALVAAGIIGVMFKSYVVIGAAAIIIATLFIAFLMRSRFKKKL
jgi:hypothetical protein